MGADFLEQDVVATRDGALIVFHDLTLDDMTDVAAAFPGRARADGRHYCVDFTLEEIRKLAVAERRAGAAATARYPDRFPLSAGSFTVATLEEELRFIQGLRRSTGRSAGVYVEIKDPAWHHAHGMDVGLGVLRTLAAFGYTERHADVFVQCFDADELRRLREAHDCRLPLVQLIGGGGSVPDQQRLREIARYANAIGPSLRLIFRPGGEGGAPAVTTLVADAHGAGLVVHPYTLRREESPPGFAGLEDVLRVLLLDLQVDGVFTDFPDIAVRYVARHFSR